MPCFSLLAEQEGARVDRFVAAARPDLSRAAVQRLLSAGHITVNGQAVRASYKVRAGDEVRVCVPPPRPARLQAEALPLDILYEDDDLLVINKAAGMVVHPGAGNPSGTLVNAVLAHCPDLRGVGGEMRPGIVHRLDKDTSGVLVVAKHDRAITGLQRQFKQRTVRKFYLTLLIGLLPQPEGIIDAPIGRHRVHRQKMAVTMRGRSARTRYTLLQELRDAQRRPFSLVRVHLLTGRTHQIRVHFAWLGYPVLGDSVYGPAHSPLPVPRQCLHAHQLTFVHPISGEEMTFTASLPADFASVLTALGGEPMW